NRIRHGRSGFEVVTPLRLAGGGAVLVNRGWLDSVRDVPTPAGQLQLEGVERKRIPRVLEAAPEQGGRLRQNLDIAQFAAETRLPLEPRVIEQHSSAADGLLREWPVAQFGAEKSAAYALQWYSLAALAAVLGLVFGFRRDPAR